MKNREINGTEEIGLVTPTPEVFNIHVLKKILVAFNINHRDISMRKNPLKQESGIIYSREFTVNTIDKRIHSVFIVYIDVGLGKKKSV